MIKEQTRWGAYLVGCQHFHPIGFGVVGLVAGTVTSSVHQDELIFILEGIYVT
jgi:hypothetical protein